MVDTLTGMLGDRLVAVVVYGSHVSGDAIASFSDLDLSIVLRGELTIDDALRLHRAMPEPAGVPYIQPSYHDVAALQPHLVPGGYREL